MLYLQALSLVFLIFLLLLSTLFLSKASKPKKQSSPPPATTVSLPRSYPIVGSFFAVLANRNRRLQWFSDILSISPSATYVLRRSYTQRQLLTANPAVVQHILKTHFNNYVKGNVFYLTFKDMLGDGIFNVDGASWKLQRQGASHEFSTKTMLGIEYGMEEEQGMKENCENEEVRLVETKRRTRCGQNVEQV